MDTAPRTHRDTALVVLTILGGAGWLAAPVAVALEHASISAALVIVGVTIAGCALGAAAAACAVPRLTLPTAAVAGAVAMALVRGGMALFEAGSMTLGWADLVDAALGAAAAAGAAALARGRSRLSLTPVLAGLVSLAVVSGVWLLGGAVTKALPGHVDRLVIWTVAVLAPVAGGSATALVVPGSRGRDIVVGWLALIASVTVAVALVSHSPLALAPGFVALLVLGPLLSFLGAAGLWLVRLLAPAATPAVPTARALP